jgi:hypothetical protein
MGWEGIPPYWMSSRVSSAVAADNPTHRSALIVVDIACYTTVIKLTLFYHNCKGLEGGRTLKEVQAGAQGQYSPSDATEKVGRRALSLSLGLGAGIPSLVATVTLEDFPIPREPTATYKRTTMHPPICTQ